MKPTERNIGEFERLRLEQLRRFRQPSRGAATAAWLRVRYPRLAGKVKIGVARKAAIEKYAGKGVLGTAGTREDFSQHLLYRRFRHLEPRRAEFAKDVRVKLSNQAGLRVGMHEMFHARDILRPAQLEKQLRKMTWEDALTYSRHPEEVRAYRFERDTIAARKHYRTLVKLLRAGLLKGKA